LGDIVLFFLAALLPLLPHEDNIIIAAAYKIGYLFIINYLEVLVIWGAI